MPKTVTENVEELPRQTASKKDRHVNNRLPDFEDFFQGNPTKKGDEKGFIWRLIKQDRGPIIVGSILFIFQNLLHKIFKYRSSQRSTRGIIT